MILNEKEIQFSRLAIYFIHLPRQASKWSTDWKTSEVRWKGYLQKTILHQE